MDVFQVDSKTTIGVEFSAKCIMRDNKIIKAQRKLHPSFLKKNNNIGVNKNNTYKSLINHKGSSIGEHGNPFVKSPNKLFNINNGERVSYKYSMVFPCKAIPITFVITNKR